MQRNLAIPHIHVWKLNMWNLKNTALAFPHFSCVEFGLCVWNFPEFVQLKKKKIKLSSEIPQHFKLVVRHVVNKDNLLVYGGPRAV